MSKTSSASKIKMSSYDELFGTEENATNDDRERIQQIPIKDLLPFKSHLFKVLDSVVFALQKLKCLRICPDFLRVHDEKMEETKESISKYGVLMPIIARLLADGGYELIAGHRRKRACELLELETIPTIIRNLDDDESTIIMVDSNIQRENLLYSEKAYAYKMKLDAIKRKAGRPKNNYTQVGHNYEKGKTSIEIVAEQSDDSRNQIQRYIRLTELIPSLLEMVDNKKLAFNTAVELSYLTQEGQEILLAKIKELEVTPSMAQASKLKKYSNEGSLTKTVIDSILSETREKPIQITLKKDKLSKYFSTDYSQKEVEEKIIELLEIWKKGQ